MGAHFAGRMAGGQHQEKASRAAPGLRILARIIARVVMARQQDSEAHPLNEADRYELRTHDTVNRRNSDYHGEERR